MITFLAVSGAAAIIWFTGTFLFKEWIIYNRLVNEGNDADITLYISYWIMNIFGIFALICAHNWPIPK